MLDNYVMHKALIQSNNNNLQAFNEQQNRLTTTTTCAAATAKCLVLVGDMGTGKTHVCCELKWPTRNERLLMRPIRESQQQQSSSSSSSMPTSVDLLSFGAARFIGAHFFSLFNSRQNSLRNFYSHMCAILRDFYVNNSKLFVPIDTNEDHDHHRHHHYHLPSAPLFKRPARLYLDHFCPQGFNFSNHLFYFIYFQKLFFSRIFIK